MNIKSEGIHNKYNIISCQEKNLQIQQVKPEKLNIAKEDALDKVLLSELNEQEAVFKENLITDINLKFSLLEDLRGAIFDQKG